MSIGPPTWKRCKDAIRDVFGPMFEAILQEEPDSHLGCKSNDHGEKRTTECRNGYGKKTLTTGMGDVEIDTPRDRVGSFEPQPMSGRIGR